jgi:hypothetical protein
MWTKMQITAMKEDDLCTKILIPLLRAMGYQDVESYHGGSAELGKDIVGWINSGGDRTNLAVVAKSVPLTGQAKPTKGSAGEVLIQVNQAFGSPYIDPRTGEDRLIHKCWIITNKGISKESRKAIKSGINQAYSNYVKFIDIDELWNMVEEYLIPSIQTMVANLAEHIQKVDSHYIPEISFGKEGLVFSVGEKYPGASQEKPIQFKGKFTFADDNVSKQKLEELERHIKTGSRADIPMQFVNLEFPDFLKNLLPFDISKADSLFMESVPSSGKSSVQIKILARR